MLNVSIGQLFNCRGLACLLSQQQHERCAVLCLVLTAGRNQCSFAEECMLESSMFEKWVHEEIYVQPLLCYSFFNLIKGI